MKQILLLALTTTLLMSCKTYNSSLSEDKHSFELLYQSEYGGKDKQTFLVAESVADLQKIVQNPMFDETLQQKLQSVDFQKHVLVLLHAGQKNTGGYSISVESIKIDKGITTVTVKETGPEPGTQVTMALSNPFAIVAVPKNEKIIFSEL
ncbi:MAG TPA: protease complex subunit PrcB family protein [Flavobacteriaceae bacterium]|nr:protease complex subunit PrcB family protein [Flavobacteriaceae bacterium]